MEYITADQINKESNLTNKIQRGKKIFLNSGIKPTGRNSFQKYNYFELKDIEPTLLDVCEELHLSTRFVFSASSANLVIKDEEDSSEVYYSIPLPEVKVEDAKRAMQDIKSIQTYAMRCLYIQAFEIVEADSIEKERIAEAKREASKSKQFQQKSSTQQSKPKNKGNKQYIQKKREVKPDRAEPVNQSRLTMNKKVSTTELVNMSKQVEQALKNEGKQLNEENIHSKVDELYKNSRGYNELIRMFDNGLKKAKKQESGYITY